MEMKIRTYIFNALKNSIVTSLFLLILIKPQTDNSFHVLIYNVQLICTDQESTIMRGNLGWWFYRIQELLNFRDMNLVS